MEDDKNLNSIIGTLAGVLSSPHFSRGDLAELRRMQSFSLPLSFWRVLFDYVPEEARKGNNREDEWVVILNGMAIMAPNIHSRDKDHSVGAVFSFFPQQRMLHFLRSRGDNLKTQIRLLARLCASKNTPIDWVTLTYLLFSGRKESEIKRKIAKEFIWVTKNNKEVSE